MFYCRVHTEITHGIENHIQFYVMYTICLITIIIHDGYVINGYGTHIKDIYDITKHSIEWIRLK